MTLEGVETYGSRGGVRAAAQMQMVLRGLHMRDTATNPALNTHPSHFASDGTFLDTTTAFEDFAQDVRTTIDDLTALLAKPIFAAD